MKESLNVAVGQSPAELAGPHERLDWLERSLIDHLGSDLDLLVLPELFLTGYNVGDKLGEWAEEKDGPMSRRISAMARDHGLAISFGLAERDGAEIFNAAVCYGADGRLIGSHRKLLLPPGFEGDHFTVGSGISLFQLGAFRIATLICYDAEFPENFRKAASAGADLVLVPTALGSQWGIVAEKLIPTRAFENGVYVCYADHCGEDHGLTYYGGSCIVGPDGQDLARADQNNRYLVAQIELGAVKTAQSRLPYLRDRLKLPWTGGLRL